MEPEIKKALDDLARRLDSIEKRILTGEDVRALKEFRRQISEIAKSAGPVVSGSPTANGYMPFTIDGKRITILVGS